MPFLIISRDGVVVQQVSLDREVITLGRLDDNQVVLPDGSVSRHHAQIERQGTQFVVKDLGSQNGIWVGGTRVPQWELQPGVPFLIGVFTATFDPSRAGQVAAPPSLGNAEGLASRAKLFVLDGPVARREISLDLPELRFGRSSSCEIAIDHDAVSKNHAKIVFQNNRYLLSDCGSRNGVFVNGLRIESQALAHRDEIEIGPARFVFSESGEFIAPPVPIAPAMPDYGGMPPSTSLETPSYAPAPMATVSVKKSLFARVPKIVWLGGAAALIIIIILIALVSGPAGPQHPGAKEISAENQQIIQKLLADGKQFYSAGDFAGALEKANAVLTPELDPTNRDALDLQARAQEKLREQTVAHAKAEEEAAQRAAKVQGLLNEANTAFQADDWITSKAKLEEARTLDPENADVKTAYINTLLAIAQGSVRKRDFTAAYEAYDATLQIDPTNAEARKGRESLASSEQAAKAREARTQSLFKDAKKAIDRGDSIQAYRLLSNVLQLNPRYPQAAQLHSQLQLLLEAKAKPLYDEGVRLFNAGQVSEAMKKFNQALAVYPDHAPTQQFIAQAIVKLREQAQEAYKRGYINEGLGRYKEALMYYQKALDLLPDPNEEYHKKAADKISQLKGKVK